MRFVGILCVSAVVIAAAAYLTKPEEADAEAALREQLMMAVAREELGAGRTAGENLALAACKLRPNDCYDLVRSGMETGFTDHVLYVRFTMSGFERAATCYGAFLRFYCPGGLATP